MKNKDYKINNAAIEERLAKEFEGKLFVEITVIFFSNTYNCHKQYYTVLQGKVYQIDGQKLQESGESLLELQVQCKKVGIYKKDKAYNSVKKEYSYSQFKKLLHL